MKKVTLVVVVSNGDRPSIIADQLSGLMHLHRLGGTWAVGIDGVPFDGAGVDPDELITGIPTPPPEPHET